MLHDQLEEQVSNNHTNTLEQNMRYFQIKGIPQLTIL